ncbi:FAD-binding protein [Mycobacterium decipiens]|uniref:FAD-binding protein n=1 Tax=Mycobacterium decipiens TaxID=1430326 RepID=A0A1X2LTN4_9MYCO|nr:FAD-binding protein [Mycobacterium decipiens]OSC39593.1 FAD-binding protein [Mycobacterium decipiens]
MANLQAENGPPRAAEVRNWAGNVAFNPKRLHRPVSIRELQGIVSDASHARALGSGHSFNQIAVTAGDLISVDRLPPVLDIDRSRMSVEVSAGVRYGQLATHLHQNGLALHNLGSLPHISVAGACATGTHGSGNSNTSLADAVTSVTLVNADGELITLSHGDPDFDGAAVSLGSLGIVTSLRLNLLPSFDVEQYVYDGLGWASLLAHFDSIMASAYSVSVFSHFDETNRIWLKHRCGDPRGDLAHLAVHPALTNQHPLAGLPATNCTEQLGVAGPWYERLPHFRTDFRPATGDELQSEYLLPKAHAVAALEALHRIRARLAPALLISEIRTVAADECWLSPSHHRDSVAIHFAWRPDMSMVMPVVADVEAALAPFDPRPHWGKLFTIDADRLRDSYQRWSDFECLMRALDPGGKFRNDLIDSCFPR